METMGKFIIRASTNPTVYYTPWMPRQADNAVFTYE